MSSALRVLQQHADEIQDDIETRDRKINETMAMLKKMNDQQQRAYVARDEVTDAIAKLGGPVARTPAGKKDSRR